MTHRTKAAILLLLLAVCGAGVLITHRLRGEPSTPAPRDLFAVVNQQLTAFRSSDFESAYRYAAMGVQQRFTLAQFERMVRETYPEIMRGYRVEYGLAELRGESAAVHVFLHASNGAVRSFIYRLTREDEAWKIDGVEELEATPARESLTGTHA